MTNSTKLLFSDENLVHAAFLATDLGQLYLTIPFEELASKIPAPRHALSGKGCKPWFDVKGGIALQFLKHYLDLSDEMIVERINTDWSMQLFCGLSLGVGERIKDTNIVSSWRLYLGTHMDISVMQEALCKRWKPFIQHTHVSAQDATCYESGIRFPTDCKLLWECCNWIYTLMQCERKHLRLRKSRSNYERMQKIYLQYQKLRKKSKRKEKKTRKTLLKYLKRLMELFDELTQKYAITLSKRKTSRIHTIEKAYKQQHQKAYGDANEKIKDRIVSLYKPYVRPIVRGKENKPVEFGAKVNKLQVDGISFIEHLSFDAFNETTRYSEAIYLHRKLFGKCTHHSADAIYATNKNRTYSASQFIQTNFIPKGKQKAQHVKQATQMRSILNKQRSTVLEGSFGNEKNHYLLQKSRARTEPTDIAWIFFGMMTANASIIAQRMQKANATERAA